MEKKIAHRGNVVMNFFILCIHSFTARVSSAADKQYELTEKFIITENGMEREKSFACCMRKKNCTRVLFSFFVGCVKRRYWLLSENLCNLISRKYIV